jgi:hypothetical protein
MIYRKGERSPAMADRGWPHQVALPADQITARTTRSCMNSAVTFRYAVVDTVYTGTMSAMSFSASPTRRMRNSFVRASMVSASIRRTGAGEAIGISGANAEPRYRRSAHMVRPRNGAPAFAGRAARPRLLSLIGRQFGLPPELDAICPR